MYIDHLTHFHVCYSSIEASDHLACATDKFQWFSTVIRGIELCSVVKGTFVMSTAGLAHIAACDWVIGSAASTTATAAAVTTGMSLFMAAAGMFFPMVMITIHAGRH